MSCPMMSAKDKVAIVTGASDGIGRAIAIGLGRAGAKVTLAARRKEMLEDAVKQIEAAGGQALAVQTDVTSRAQVKQLVADTEAAFGPVDVLVNNAAAYYLTLMKNLKEDAWERVVDVNCKGLLNGIGAVLGGMVDRGQGHIVNISSDSGREATPGMAVYAGSKFFVEGLSQSLRREVGGLGVKVTTIQPGYVDTAGLNGMTDFDPEAARALNLNAHDPDCTMLAAEDIANAVVYAVCQPPSVAVNEMLVQPTNQGALQKQ